MTEFVTCDECGGTVPADTFDEHGCITDPEGYDPNEPWMDDVIWVDDDEEERDA